MNPEAISGIKATSRQCGELRSLLNEHLYNDSNLSGLFNKSENFIAANHLTPARNSQHGIAVFINGQTAAESRHFSANDIITVSIALKLNDWVSECSFSHSGTDNHFIETNRNAVIETAESLCPGLPFSDITGVIEMSAGEYKIEPTDLQLTLPETSDIIFNLEDEKGRLKAGSIINIRSVFSKTAKSPQTNGVTALCRHSETVLITGNGAEILTIN